MTAVLLITAIALVGRVLLLPVNPIPQPTVQDEFSYLLQADTFLHGRLANPTPAFWQHFETIHIFFRPTYSSMYFPAEGLFLAFGRLLGNAWIGALVSGALMCGAIVWMLQAWMPYRWAFFGGLLVILRTQLFSYWVDGYWGGAHSALGGALVLGAWPRLSRAKPGRRRIADAIAMAVGLVILAYGRPYEGLLLCLPVAFAMFFTWGKPARDPRVLVPVTLVLAVGLTWLGFFFWRVTGDPFRIPYSVNRSIYGWPQTLLFMKTSPVPASSHMQLVHYGNWEKGLHEQTKSWNIFVFQTLQKIIIAWTFYAGPVLTLPLLMFPWILWRDHRFRPLLAPCAIMIGGLGLSQSMVPHYVGPAAAGIFALILQGFRHLRVASYRKFRFGLPLVRAVPVVLLIVLAIRLASFFVDISPYIPMHYTMFSWCCMSPIPRFDREKYIKLLENTPGNHLVFLSYSKIDPMDNDWVYNDADIPNSRVIWADQLSPEKDAQLREFYKDRRVWIMMPDEKPPRLVEWQP